MRLAFIVMFCWLLLAGAVTVVAVVLARGAKHYAAEAGRHSSSDGTSGSRAASPPGPVQRVSTLVD